MSVSLFVPMRNQLTEPAVDGHPNINRYYNCCATSIGAGIYDLAGIVVYGDELKDWVYGPSYTGGTAARSYIPLVASKYGVRIDMFGGTQAQLIAKIVSELNVGHPVLVTMPSQWGTAPANPVDYSGGSHVGLAYAYDSSSITVMNPWGGFAQKQSLAWWAARLVYGTVWPMSRIFRSAPLPAGWAWNDAAGTLTAPNGVVMRGGMAAKKRADILAGVDQSGYPRNAEFITHVDDGPITAENLGSCTWVWRDGYPAPRYATDTEMSAMIAYEHSQRAAA